MGSLRKPRRQCQLERGQTEGLIISGTVSVHVYNNSWYMYISLPSFIKQQCEMTIYHNLVSAKILSDSEQNLRVWHAKHLGKQQHKSFEKGRKVNEKLAWQYHSNGFPHCFHVSEKNVKV